MPSQTFDLVITATSICPLDEPGTTLNSLTVFEGDVINFHNITQSYVSVNVGNSIFGALVPAASKFGVNGFAQVYINPTLVFGNFSYKGASFTSGASLTFSNLDNYYFMLNVNTITVGRGTFTSPGSTVTVAPTASVYLLNQDNTPKLLAKSAESYGDQKLFGDVTPTPSGVDLSLKSGTNVEIVAPLVSTANLPHKYTLGFPPPSLSGEEVLTPPDASGDTVPIHVDTMGAGSGQDRENKKG